MKMPTRLYNGIFCRGLVRSPNGIGRKIVIGRGILLLT
jgi:hypothetical protein